VKVEDKVLAVLSEGTTLVAKRVEGDWISVTIEEGGKKVNGWVYAKHVAAKKPLAEFALLSLGVGQLDKALAECDALGEIEPDSVDPFFIRGLCRRVEGDFDRAIAECDALLEVAAKKVEWRGDAVAKMRQDDRNFLACVHSLRGAARERKGDLEAALADFDEAIRLDPTYVVARWNRFLVCLMLGRQDAAQAERRDLRTPGKKDLESIVSLFDSLTMFRPELVEPHVVRGFCYWMEANLEKAAAEYSEALRLDPSQAEVYFRRGLIRHAQGKHAEAAADLAKAKELAPRFAEAIWAVPAKPEGK
jgi:tetratricopeptide (TPR) repeat protein